MWWIIKVLQKEVSESWIVLAWRWTRLTPPWLLAHTNMLYAPSRSPHAHSLTRFKASITRRRHTPRPQITSFSKLHIAHPAVNWFPAPSRFLRSSSFWGGGCWDCGKWEETGCLFLRMWPALLYISLIVNKSHEKMTPRNWLLSYKYFGRLGFVAVHMAAKYLLRIYGFVATNIYKKSWLLIKNIWFCHHKHVCKKSWLLINIIQFCHYKPDCRTSWLLTKIIQFCCHKHNSKISWLLV